MDHLMAEMPEGKDIHVILDNYCIHKRNDPWLAAHPNVVFHFTPTSASWLNQVEIWFGIFARKALKGASFETSRNCVRPSKRLWPPMDPQPNLLCGEEKSKALNSETLS